MVATLKYRFVKCEKLNENIIPQWKGNEAVREHKYYNEADIKNFRDACKYNPEMQLYVELSIEMAPRIQDLAELSWSGIKEIKDGHDKGYGLVFLKKQKTTERRDVMISPETMQKLKAYKDIKGLPRYSWPNEKIFKNNSANALLIRIKRFFAKHSITDF